MTNGSAILKFWVGYNTMNHSKRTFRFVSYVETILTLNK